MKPDHLPCAASTDLYVHLTHFHLQEEHYNDNRDDETRMETNESQSGKTFCPEHAPILFDTPRQHVKASKNTYVQQCATIFELASKELEVKDYKRLKTRFPLI